MLASDRAVSRFYPGSAPRLQSRLSTWAPGFLSIKRLHSSPITVHGNPGRSRRLAIYRPQVVFIGPYLCQRIKHTPLDRSQSVAHGTLN